MAKLEQCTQGHEFFTPGTDLARKNNGYNDYVEGVTCPAEGCGKTFKRLVLNKLGQAYLPEHHTGGYKPEGTKKPKAAPVTEAQPEQETVAEALPETVTEALPETVTEPVKAHGRVRRGAKALTAS